LNENHSNNKAVNDYNDLATDLLDWTNKWIPWLQNKSDDHSLNDANRRLNDFRHYRLEEKPPRIENKSNLENIYDTLQTRRQLSNRPSFKPKDGQLLSVIRQ
jgi:actinin alpha